MKYVVTIEGREIEVEIEGERVRIDGQERHAHLSVLPGTPLRQLVVDGRSVPLSVAEGEAGRGRGHWVLNRRGEEWVVEVVDERTRHIRSLAGAPEGRLGGGAVKAPMPGLVVRVQVAVGDLVEPGDSLVVLEAMKMENELRAPQGGRVAAIGVEAGMAVEKGEVLVELAPGDVPAPGPAPMDGPA